MIRLAPPLTAESHLDAEGPEATSGHGAAGRRALAGISHFDKLIALVERIGYFS
jgi:hypothetical protein